MLHRFTGRCPPRGLIFLGAALRKIVALRSTASRVAALKGWFQ